LLDSDLDSATKSLPGTKTAATAESMYTAQDEPSRTPAAKNKPRPVSRANVEA
jgi:hypothetical protein